jgi:glycosyltransferase involved in cell wall biosynthesis
MKKALIHDWYYVSGGAEKVVHSINNIWSNLEHHALIDFLDENDRDFILNGKSVKTSFIQKLPTSKSNHRKFIQFFPMAIEQFDLREYDLVLSSSASVAKGVLTHSNQLHISYCHSPMRYAWDLYHQYLTDTNIRGLKGMYAKYVLHKIRIWDVISSNRVDFFVANSRYIANRIRKTYNRESKVIYPPVEVDKFNLVDKKEDFYFTASRMVPYKKIELIVRAFNNMPNKKLIVSGDGPEFLKIKQIAKPNIKLLGFADKKVLKWHLENAKAFVFAAEEDFGIIPVEAQACGTPVIGFGRGGLLETVVHGKTGILFKDQTEKAIIDATNHFETKEFMPEEIKRHAEQFSKNRFEEEFKAFVEEKYEKFKRGDQ